MTAPESAVSGETRFVSDLILLQRDKFRFGETL